MKLSIGLFLSVFGLCQLAEAYKPTESDLKRDALFKKCSVEYKFVQEIAKRHSARTTENMDKCAETCSAKLMDSSYKACVFVCFIFFVSLLLLF